MNLRADADTQLYFQIGYPLDFSCAASLHNAMFEYANVNAVSLNIEVEPGHLGEFCEAVKALKIGAPYVKGASVEARVLKSGKGRKLTVFTYRPKKGSKRKMGHRQPYTKVQIEAVNAKAPRAPKAEAPANDAE